MIRGIFLSAALICGLAPTTTPVLAQSTSTPASAPGQSTPESTTPASGQSTPESAPPTQTTPASGASSSSGSSSSTPAELKKLLDALNLTPHQRKEVDGIQSNAERQFRSIMTPEQLAQFDSNIKAGKRGSETFDSLNLTDDQRQKLNGVQQMIIAQLFSVLTPEQIQTMMQQVQGK
jgi:Spy/CpxP family protein refolding chaperone